MGTKIEINRSEIARATDTNVSHISRIFSGKVNPSLLLAVKIASHLDITLDDLCSRLGITAKI